MYDAAKRRDVDAFYASLDSDARAALSKKEVAALLKSANDEIVERLKALSAEDSSVLQEASVRYADGERSTLAFERDGYRVTSAGAFPSTARSPAEALGDLRRALARRSHTALVLVLSADARAALQEQLDGLATALEQPEALDIRVDGDSAMVRAPDGHWVELKREGGVWKVRDFE